jgi:predicted RNase H-like HicB family nuclease
MKYAVIYEKTTTGYSSYAPDLPGCVAAGDTIEETEKLMQEAIELHLAGMREDGDPIPEPTTRVGMLPIEPPKAAA